MISGFLAEENEGIAAVFPPSRPLKESDYPDYFCMVCGERTPDTLVAVPYPIETGGKPWWVCRPGYGCALTTAGKLDL